MKLASIKDAKAAALVAEAADLARQHKAIEVRLDEIKDTLRSKAEAISAKRPKPLDRQMVVFESDAGACSVIFASEIPRLASGSDPEALIASFGDVDWDKIFRKRFLLAPEWQETLALAPKPVQKAVNKLVDWEPSTSRVVFPK